MRLNAKEMVRVAKANLQRVETLLYMQYGRNAMTKGKKKQRDCPNVLRCCHLHYLVIKTAYPRFTTTNHCSTTLCESLGAKI